MTKNITVTDKNGKIIGSTYPKRALGLVKNDRARWINADTICLCAQKMEDKDMANSIYEVFDNQISKMQAQLRDDEPETALQVRIQILKTMEVFRAQEQGTKILDMVKEQLNFLQKDLEKSADMDFSNLQQGGLAFVERENTKQRMIDFMEQFIHYTMSPNTPMPSEFNKTEVVSDINPEAQDKSKEFSEQLSEKINDEINSAFNKTEE